MGSKSEATAFGNYAHEVYRNTAHSGVRIAQFAADILRAQANNPTPDRQTIAIAAELTELGMYLSETHWRMADGDYGEARASSKHLLADNTGVQKP